MIRHADQQNRRKPYHVDSFVLLSRNVPDRYSPAYLFAAFALVGIIFSGCSTTRPIDVDERPNTVILADTATFPIIPGPEVGSAVVELPRTILPADTLLLSEEKRKTFIENIGITLLGSGRASYYGKKFAGRRTANGERFDPDQLTAAHRTLPFGSQVRVTNLDNGKSVIVRINDRGPFIKRRIIDLSYAAAKQIDMILAGRASVKIELLPVIKMEAEKEEDSDT